MRITVIILLLSVLIAHKPAAAAAQMEELQLRSDRAYADVSKDITVQVYEGNVFYQSGQFTMQADKLMSKTDEDGTVTAEGDPVKVRFIDELGEETNIESPEITYKQKTGEITAQGAIKIEQTSKGDLLTLTGNRLQANNRISKGFSFILNGNQAQFTLQQPSREKITAVADTLRSNGKDRKTELVGSVKFSQGLSNTTSDILTYDGEKKIISAGRTSDDSEQVVTTLFWKNEESDDKTATEKELEKKPDDLKKETLEKEPLEKEAEEKSEKEAVNANSGDDQ